MHLAQMFAIMESSICVTLEMDKEKMCYVLCLTPEQKSEKWTDMDVFIVSSVIYIFVFLRLFHFTV